MPINRPLRPHPLSPYYRTGLEVPARLNPPGHRTQPIKPAIILALGDMHTMRKIAMLSMLTLFGSLTARADYRSEYILTWISDHLQTVSYTVTTPRARYAEYESAKMEFDGCNVKIVEDLNAQQSNTQTTVSFNLSNIQSNMIRFRSETGTGDTQVTTYFLVQLPLVGTTTNTTTFSASGGSKTDTTVSSSVSLLFQDRNLANRQVAAWRDAALACGAK